MTDKATAIRILDEASESLREEAGMKRPIPDLGKSAGAKDERLSAIAERVAATQFALPPLPKTGALTTLLIIIFVAAALFLAALFFAHDQDFLPALLVGQGTVFTALTGVAAFLARIQNASVSAYNQRAAEWMRTDAVVRILREMSRGGELSPKMTVALLDALRAAFPSRTS